MNEALCLITGGHPETPAKSEFLCLSQVGKTVRGNGKKTWRRESLGMGERTAAILSGRLAAFSAKFDLEVRCTCQLLGLETDRRKFSIAQKEFMEIRSFHA